MYLKKQKKEELIRIIDECIENNKLFTTYVIMNEQISLEGYKGKKNAVFKLINDLEEFKEWILTKNEK